MGPWTWSSLPWPWEPRVPNPETAAERLRRKRSGNKKADSESDDTTSTTAAAAAAAATTTTTPQVDDKSTDVDPSRTSVSQALNQILNPPKVESVAWTGYPNERLSIPFEYRACILLGASFVAGMLVGGGTGGQQAADRYRAENAHRLPETKAGWYLYHRSKNYNMLMGAITKGVRAGAMLSLLSAGFLVTEEGIDQLRARILHRPAGHECGQRDFLSTLAASLAMAGVYSRVQGFNIFTTVKTSTMGFKYGLAYGLTQDALAFFRGEEYTPDYLRWLRRRVYGSTTSTTSSSSGGSGKADDGKSGEIQV